MRYTHPSRLPYRCGRGCPDLLVQPHPVLQRLVIVLVRDHAGLFRGKVQVAVVPGLEIGEFVLGRQGRVRLAIALDLGHLVDRLEALPAFRMVPGQGRAATGLEGEHEAVRQIAVRRDRQHAAAGRGLVGRHPAPQILGIDAFECRVGKIWSASALPPR